MSFRLNFVLKTWIYYGRLHFQQCKISSSDIGNNVSTDTRRTNDEMYLRKLVSLLCYLHLYLDIKTQISDCYLKFLSYSTQNHSERRDGQNRFLLAMFVVCHLVIIPLQKGNAKAENSTSFEWPRMSKYFILRATSTII